MSYWLKTRRFHRDRGMIIKIRRCMKVHELKGDGGWIIRLWRSPWKLRHIMPEHEQLAKLLESKDSPRAGPLFTIRLWRPKSREPREPKRRKKRRLDKRFTLLAFYRLHRELNVKRFKAIKDAVWMILQARSWKKLARLKRDPDAANTKKFHDALHNRTRLFEGRSDYITRKKFRKEETKKEKGK